MLKKTSDMKIPNFYSKIIQNYDLTPEKSLEVLITDFVKQVEGFTCSVSKVGTRLQKILANMESMKKQIYSFKLEVDLTLSRNMLSTKGTSLISWEPKGDTLMYVQEPRQ